MTEAPAPKVLMVDDRVGNLIAMESVLRALPTELVRAHSGNEALALMLRDEFALVLLDVQMPGMDGFEVASLMRSNERTEHVPIIFLTAFGDERRHVARGYESGAVDFLFKPIDPDTLKSKVDVFLRLHRQNRALAVLAELKRTERELEWAKSDLESFVRAASHDLREPARTISITADVLESALAGRLDDECRASLDTLRQRSRRIISMLGALEEYASVGGEHGWLRTDLNETLHAVTTQLRDPIRATNARIEAAPLPVVDGHPSQLRSLLIHLISNSLKFHREGTAPRIVVSGELLTPDDARQEGFDSGEACCALSVADNGIGLAEGEGLRLFSAFVHLQSRERFEGAHVGLAVCRRIVERHRGRIRASGRLGEGTTIRVTLPLRQGGARQRPAGEQQRGAPRAEHSG